MTDHAKRNAIVLLLDGLNPVYLSPFGCTWIDTPAFDQLAAESVIFERAVTESIDPIQAFAGFLSSSHPALDAATADSPSLELLKTAGIHRLLLTDDAEVAANSDQVFDQIIQLDALPESADIAAAEEVSQTALAKCFAAAMTEIPKQASPFLAVIYLGNLTKVWDAPRELRERHRDEDDPEALDIVVPPNQVGDFDPDEILGVTHACAAQLETLDTCLHVFLHELQQDGLLDESRLIVAGLRGFPLGHRGRMGHGKDHVLSDATCVPLFVRPANVQQKVLTAVRSHELTATSDWLPLASGWLLNDTTHRLEAALRGETGGDERSREFVVLSETDARAIWTPAWLLVEQGDRPELFVKPDDRWDVNPVQDRCRWIAEDLGDVLAKICEQLCANETPAVDSLADELVFGLE